MQQRMDLGTALNAGKWWLTQKAKGRGFADTKTLKVEGSVDMQVQHTMVPIELLDLPLDIKKQILIAMDKYNAEQEAKEVEAKQIGMG